MTQASELPEDELSRLHALSEYDILDTQAEDAFDDLTKLAAHICDAPIALVSLIDVSRQWFKAKTGISAQETPRDVAFCAHAIRDPETVLQVCDASLDPRFKANPLVTEDPNIRFYAGAPLITGDGYALGTLCVIDRKPRRLTQQQLDALESLGRQVMRNLELRRTVKDLERSNRALESFAFVASHDLQEPLRTITSFIGILEKRYSFLFDETAEGYMRHIVDGSKRMKAMIDDLLTFSRIGADELKREPVDVASLVSRITDDLRVQIKSLDGVVEARDLPTVHADHSKLSMLLHNLVGNALKYHGDRTPHVKITAEEQSTQWLFCVRDNGIGIDPINHSKIFDLFKRLHGRSEVSGTGIGLSICKRIVQHLGGRIWVASESGEGAQFFFTIPRHDCI